YYKATVSIFSPLEDVKNEIETALVNGEKVFPKNENRIQQELAKFYEFNHDYKQAREKYMELIKNIFVNKDYKQQSLAAECMLRAIDLSLKEENYNAFTELESMSKQLFS